MSDDAKTDVPWYLEPPPGKVIEFKSTTTITVEKSSTDGKEWTFHSTGHVFCASSFESRVHCSCDGWDQPEWDDNAFASFLEHTQQVAPFHPKAVR